jgi:hypothetical protein
MLRKCDTSYKIVLALDVATTLFGRTTGSILLESVIDGPAPSNPLVDPAKRGLRELRSGCSLGIDVPS